MKHNTDQNLSVLRHGHEVLSCDSPKRAVTADSLDDQPERGPTGGGVGDAHRSPHPGDSLLLDLLSIDNDDSERCFFITCVSFGVLSLDLGRF